jgi:hypothetical protein
MEQGVATAVKLKRPDPEALSQSSMLKAGVAFTHRPASQNSVKLWKTNRSVPSLVSSFWLARWLRTSANPSGAGIPAARARAVSATALGIQ